MDWWYRICSTIISMDNQMNIDTKGNVSKRIKVFISIYVYFVRGCHGLKPHHSTRIIDSSNFEYANERLVCPITPFHKIYNIILINRLWCYKCWDLHVHHNICVTKLWALGSYFLYLHHFISTLLPIYNTIFSLI